MSKMSLEEKINEWLSIADEDLEVAQLCYKNKKYLHCAFLCQQAVEKTIKARIATNNEIPYPIHDLAALAEDAEIWEMLSAEQRLFLRALTTYAISTRYPDKKRRLLSVCNEEESRKILISSKETVLWLKEKISEKLSQEKQSSEDLKK
jgi:HEPN domain-containing protein